ncbi:MULTISPECIES: hypothetical protein [Ramlibacter]|uniref:Glycosyl transferase n=1 Tax=Ramlibacter pinisoli TaxID=2682844 RepID=A0A6N8IW56_9BURK|nr:MULTISPECIES: hypothetical protein [Ramlibacter]MBA2961249.1 hypothetical protein [Ramlibacter sp. CGMCC 1.13660]MVQ31194.1 hypothetical protein [Ramlibacter pinisoli]
MQPRILFLIMSAVSRPETVDQLAGTLAPHVALVHHDFSQTPHFPLDAPNVRLVPEPKRTGWAYFGFVDGIFHSLRHALRNFEFDYLQLLSPTCLPIKPIAQFEACVDGGAQAHFDCIDLLGDRDALMSVGYRAFTPQDTWRHRVARQASNLYFGNSPGRRDEAGIWLHSGEGRGLLSWPSALLIKALARPAIGRHPFGEAFRPYYGSAWFGARREMVEGMVRLFERPGVRDYFSGLRIAEEFLFPTLLMQLAATRGPMNHEIQRFDGAHVGTFGEGDLQLLRDSPAYFARKFPDDPAAPVRQRVVGELLRDGSAPSPAAPVRLHSVPSVRPRATAAKPGTHVQHAPGVARDARTMRP